MQKSTTTPTMARGEGEIAMIKENLQVATGAGTARRTLAGANNNERKTEDRGWNGLSSRAETG